MSLSYKTTTANAILDNIYDTQLGTSPVLEIRSGAAAGPDNAAGGSLGVSISAPATAFSAAASKSKAKTGTWSNTASGSITAGHFRLKTSGGTAFEEGTVGTSGSDLNVDNTSINSGQTVTVTAFTRTSP